MANPRFLIDTNIIIGLEDNSEVGAAFSELSRKSQTHGIQLYVHEAAKQDVERDKDQARKRVTLSKIQKFPILEGIPIPEQSVLESKYGRIVRPNDLVDNALLYTINENGAADFLITQDRGIHKKAQNLNIPDKVFTVEDAVAWLRKKYERQDVKLPYISQAQCQQIDRNDDIFNSLRDDYNEFDQWFLDSCVRGLRHCWTIKVDDSIAGIAIRKEETLADLLKDIPTAASFLSGDINKVLKICTFKVKDTSKGEKFGEQLLKQILWFASINDFPVTYVTVYPKHKSLIDLLLFYGFRSIGHKGQELYLAKVFDRKTLAASVETPDDAIEYHKFFYPRFKDDSSVSKFIVPIKGAYHAQLFPEITSKKQPGLFDASHGFNENRIPGNTIRKVYVCKSKIKKVKTGDLVYFYHLKDDNSAHSQTLTTVGVVDGFHKTTSGQELIALTGKRSVFSNDELDVFTGLGADAVTVVNFLLTGHLKPIPFETLKDAGILNGAPQSICEIDDGRYQALKSLISLGM